MAKQAAGTFVLGAKEYLTTPPPDSLLHAARLALEATATKLPKDAMKTRAGEVLQAIDPDFRAVASQLQNVSATPSDFLFLVASTVLFEDPPKAIARMVKDLGQGGYRLQRGRTFLIEAEARAQEAGSLLKTEVVSEITEGFIGASYWTLDEAFRVPASDRYHTTNQVRTKINELRGREG